MKSKDGEQVYAVKISVRRRGCNGYSYVMNYSKPEEVGKLDEVIEDKGVRVVID
jgi:Fe-S cluster assembly iron-binding protein IscA